METSLTRIRSMVVPAALLGCLFVIWVGTMAAQAFPSSLSQGPVAQAAASLSGEGANPPAQPAQPGECTLPSRFPDKIRQWCDLIQKYASDYQLEANLIAAVMLQESGGNPGAYSASGAVGLLQVMPRDGLAADFQCPNGPCFASRPTIEELKDPSFNLQYGARMLSGLLKKYGNLRDALKSYGPANVGYYYADKVLAIYQNYK